MRPCANLSLSPIFLLSFLLIACTNTRKDYYPEGGIKSEIHYSNDRMNGPAVFYYPNGNKQLECNYQDDSLEGIATRWYLNGVLQSEDNYRNNRKNGVSKAYDETGQLVLEDNYVMDTLQGVHKEYHPNGEIAIEGSFNKGLWDGIWNYYDPRGLLIGKGDFKKGAGILDGYYWNGKIQRQVAYSNNLKDGKELWFAEDGKIIREVLFQEGKVVETLIDDSTQTTQNKHN